MEEHEDSLKTDSHIESEENWRKNNNEMSSNEDDEAIE